MKISYNWLKQYLDFDLSPEETEEKLTLLGLEVEELIQTGSDFEGLIVGEVLEVKDHPNADKLTICKVNLGTEEVQIICGAKNVAAGQKVPVATVGSTLPLPMEDGSFLKIKKAKLRGEVSYGMICSESELGLSDDHSGIMVLDKSAETGSDLKTVLKAEKDVVFEIGLTPNRPDASCHIGVARDLSAVLKKSLKNPYSGINSKKGDISGKIDIEILDKDKCHRYAGILVQNVEVKESPDWLKNRLMAIGLRPINNVVDVTNFVLHEIGQPLHAFDYDLIKGKKIIVKSFDKDIKFKTLDSIERNVLAGSLFICDGDGPVAIAGVMGGENSEVTDSTKNILIESAYFEPSSIRKTSKSLALQTDSSYRFERGIDPTIQLKAAQRAAEMIADLSGGDIVAGYSDVHPVKTEALNVNLRVSRVNRVLGTDLDMKSVSSILNGLEIQTKEADKDTLSCTIPTFRPDISREIDLIEEIGRVFDYNNIPRPESAPFISPENLSELELFHQSIRNFSKNLGYKEISTNSLLSKKEADVLADDSKQVHTLNPVSQENTTLRTHLTGGFLKVVRYNLNRNAITLRFFEIGHVFKKSTEGNWVDGVEEHIHLLLGVCGLKKGEDWKGKAEAFSVFDLKSDLESLFDNLGIIDDLKKTTDGNQTLNYKLDGLDIAVLKQVDDRTLRGFDVDKDALIAEINLTHLFNLGLQKKKIKYSPISKFPSFEFDVAFTVDKDLRAGDLTETIRNEAGTILKNVSVFDIYEGENLGKNKKSIAFRLTFLDSNKTLNIKDVEPVVKKIVQSLEKNTGAKLRS
jgi:phenylalanyl-tRNA synthetase beta chain